MLRFLDNRPSSSFHLLQIVHASNLLSKFNAPLFVVVLTRKQCMNDAKVARRMHGIGDLLEVKREMALSSFCFVESRSTPVCFQTGRTIP